MAESIYKIVLMGLDNAGKTSIVLSMAGKYDPSEIKPTQGIERSDSRILGSRVFRWDLGGQDKYRETYLKGRSYVLDQTDLLFYVIDIADKDRFEESLQFYNDVLNYLKKIETNPIIILFLHKADPDFLRTPECQANVKHVTDLFTKNSQDFQTEFFTTTIFDYKTLVEAFTNSLSKIFPKFDAFNTLLKNFIANRKLDVILLFDEDLHLVGRAYADENSKLDRIQEIYNTYYFFEGITRFKRFGYDLTLNLIRTEGNAPYQIKIQQILLGNWKSFILLAGKEIAEVEKLLTDLMRDYEANKDKLGL